jgi:hypothetical protein
VDGAFWPAQIPTIGSENTANMKGAEGNAKHLLD